MIFSRGVLRTAERDYQRILDSSGPDERPLIEECWALLVGLLRYDPHLQGRGAPGVPFRVITCGLLQALYVVHPLDDRYVSVQGVGRNPNWVP